jgi:hypothetical protein
MKKTLLGLTIAIFTFSLGISIGGLLNSKDINTETLKLQTAVEENTVFASSIPYEGSKNNENTSFEQEYPLTPEGIYFPSDEREAGTALILVIFENKAEGTIKIGSKRYRYKSAYADGDKFTLKTRTKSGIEYSFEGNFLKNGFKEYFDDSETVLRGTLRKSVKGKQVYAVRTEFTYASEVCAWRDEKVTYIE